MKKIIASFFALAALACFCSAATDSKPSKIPPELVGEWSTSTSKFSGDAISAGSALYLLADGMAGFIGAPPPIGIRGEATYDASALKLTVTLLDDDDGGRARGTVVYSFDPRGKTLSVIPAKPKDEIFKRRRDQVPDFVLKDLQKSKSRARR